MDVLECLSPSRLTGSARIIVIPYKHVSCLGVWAGGVKHASLLPPISLAFSAFLLVPPLFLATQELFTQPFHYNFVFRTPFKQNDESDIEREKNRYEEQLYRHYCVSE